VLGRGQEQVLGLRRTRTPQTAQEPRQGRWLLVLEQMLVLWKTHHQMKTQQRVSAHYQREELQQWQAPQPIQRRKTQHVEWAMLPEQQLVQLQSLPRN
jgi:hypothetical protein